MWPYSYDSCDVGTFPNQTNKQGEPNAAQTGNNGGPISFMPGQRASACTCPGSDHPGPNVNVGRGAPEIDVYEAQVSNMVGEVSQSQQVAPFNAEYQYNNEPPATTLYNPNITRHNSYLGGPYQQAISSVTKISNSDYERSGGEFAVFGVEYWSDPNNRNDGFITWMSQGEPSWQITSASIGPDPVTEVGQRLISEEPMVKYIH